MRPTVSFEMTQTPTHVYLLTQQLAGKDVSAEYVGRVSMAAPSEGYVHLSRKLDGGGGDMSSCFHWD